jgi:serine/threonine protein phosphatase 1
MTDPTEGQRLYAIGDIHGCSQLLRSVLARIRDDLAARPHPAPLLVFLGDYVDRGPDSRGVLDTLAALRRGRLPARFLLGNHDDMLLAYLDAPPGDMQTLAWFEGPLGGAQTLASYGVEDIAAAPHTRTHAAFTRAFPRAHRTFLEACELSIRIGGYVFAHAGIRPGMPLAAQSREDLLWIRDVFLGSTRDFGFKVVHGHSIVRAVEHHPNRIAVDTGAVRTGRLSCVVLEGSEIAALGPHGPEPLPVIRAGLGRFGRAVRSLKGFRTS